MPNLSVLRVLLRELISQQQVTRIPEPDLIMSNTDQVATCTQAGIESCAAQAVYLFNCAHISEVIRPGDAVLDPACGSANQLCMVARLNPHILFIGIDLSAAMLDQAKEQIKKQNLNNVTLLQGDISNFAMFADHSVNAVIATIPLHHLPTAEHLYQTFKEISRVMTKNGGLYLADFSRLKSKKSMQYFAHQHADLQGKFLTLDHLNSLKAAFSLEDFRIATAHLAVQPRLYSTFGVPFMVAIKSVNRFTNNPFLQDQLTSMRKSITSKYLANLSDLILFFKLGKLSSTLL